MSLALFLWESLLPGPISTLIQNQEEPMLRCTGCDCIANIGIQHKIGFTSSGQNSLIFDQISVSRYYVSTLVICSFDHKK